MKWFKKNSEVVEEQEHNVPEVNLHEDITATEYYSTIYDLTDHTKRQFRNLMNLESESTRSLDQLLSVNRETTDSIQEAADSSRKLEQSNSELEEKIAAVAAEMQTSSDAIDGSRDHFSAMNDIVKDLDGFIGNITSEMTTLRKEFDNISTKAQSIDDIAESTTILALNASIEANRAGEAGKGFSVVASETSNLAQSTKGFSRDILSSMNELKNVVMQLQKQVEYVTKVIERTNATVGEVTDGFETIRKSDENVSAHLDDVLALQKENVGHINRMSDTMEDVVTKSEEDSERIKTLVDGVDSRSASYKDIANDLEQMNMLAEKVKKQA
ncbi:methyl-accepting chemotaxis protein [Ligilactobacillus sp.]|uniref:methyl-accepting chemotaxis protein n=1 Tax=Ligilactobacillus sp. TaxID=2767921 RepID=UPI002FDFBFC3